MPAIVYNKFHIVPAPFVRIEKEYIRSDDDHKIGSTFNVGLIGKFLPCKGSPTSSGTFWTDGIGDGPPDELITNDEVLKSFLHKQEAIRDLFSQDGQAFEIRPWDDTPSVSGYPIVKSINFQEGNWVTSVDYTVELEFAELHGYPGAEDFADSEDYFVDSVGNKLFLRGVGEEWALEFENLPENFGAGKEHTYRLAHNLSAAGKEVYDENGLIDEAWVQARRWVNSRLGIDNNFLHATSGLNLPAHYGGFDHVRSETTNKQEGSYAVQENWIISSGNYIEDFTVTTSTQTDSPFTQVSVDGTIRGLETRDLGFEITENKWTSASAQLTTLTSGTITQLFDRAQAYSGITNLNFSALATNIGRNPVAGTVSYSYAYDDRPSNCIPNATSESIVVTDTNSHDVFALIPVLGRASGPILQDINSQTEYKRSVAINAIIPASTGCMNDEAGVITAMALSPKTDVAVVLNAFLADLNTNYTQVFKDADSESWEPKTGKYSRTIEWTAQSCT